MAILTQSAAAEAAVAKSIEPFEKDINEYLSLDTTVSFLADTAYDKHFVYRTYKNRHLTDADLDALKASIEAAGWKSVKVENRVEEQPSTIARPRPPVPYVHVEFYVEEQSSGTGGESGDEGGEGGETPSGTTEENTTPTEPTTPTGGDTETPTP